MDRKIRNWETLAKDGDELFEYLINNYENMLDGEDKVKHFDIENGDYLSDDTIYIKDTYSDELQKELVPWIKNEFQKNELFKIENWKPFRDHNLYFSYIYLGYRNLFQFKHYIFQLTISFGCEEEDTCIHCIKENLIGTFRIRLGLGLYGWKDENYVKLQPRDRITVLDDNILPETYWAQTN